MKVDPCGKKCLKKSRDIRSFMKIIHSELKNISSDELLSRTKNIVAEERRLTVLLISHLEEIQTRRLYAKQGFSSMWEFCTHFLGLSEGAAQRRLAAMRLAHDAPEAKAALESGALSLSNAAKIHSFRQNQKKQGKSPMPAQELIRQVESMSQRECEAKLHEISPEALPLERERIVSAQRDHELKMVITDEVYQKLQQIRGLLAHAKPNATLSELLEYLVNETLPRLEKKKGITTETAAAAKVPAVAAPAKAFPAGQRIYLPITLRREVFARARGRCEYIYRGRRCTSRFALELDHIRPLALGGANDRDNLRALCKCHNLQQAQAKLGEFKRAG